MQHDSAGMRIVNDESVLPMSDCADALVRARPVGVSNQTVLLLAAPRCHPPFFNKSSAAR
jgi:hypothetical protein